MNFELWITNWVKLSVDYNEDQRLPARHANFLIANGAVLVQKFQDDDDRVAQEPDV